MMNRKTATQKAAALAGSTAAVLAAAAPTSDAAVVLANGFLPGDTAPPTVPDDVTSFLWDVDGDGNNDFRFRTSGSSYGAIDSKGFGGGGMIQPIGDSYSSYDAQNLSQGFVVGPTLASGYVWGVARNTRYITSSSSEVGTDLIDGVFNSDENYIGFRFDIGGSTHYGWMQLRLGSQQVVNAAYNNVAGQPIVVGQIPEPSSMALLGLGIAGLGMLRRRTKR